MVINSSHYCAAIQILNFSLFILFFVQYSRLIPLEIINKSFGNYMFFSLVWHHLILAQCKEIWCKIFHAHFCRSFCLLKFISSIIGCQCLWPFIYVNNTEIRSCAQHRLYASWQQGIEFLFLVLWSSDYERDFYFFVGLSLSNSVLFIVGATYACVITFHFHFHLHWLGYTEVVVCLCYFSSHYHAHLLNIIFSSFWHIFLPFPYYSILKSYVIWILLKWFLIENHVFFL